MARLFLGIDIGGTNVKFAWIDSSGRMIHKATMRTQAEAGPEDAFARIVETVRRVMGRDALAGVGIGCAGLIDRGKRRLLASPNLPAWSGAWIGRISDRALGVYTILDNDANAAAYGEFSAGAGRGAKTFIVVTLGTGVGGSIIHEGTIFRGARNYAGEIGHVTINERGPLCKCGNRGCLEAYLGANALVKVAKRRIKSTRSVLGRLAAEHGSLTPRLIGQAARSGDRIARSVLEDAADHLGTALAGVVNLINPDRIVIAGGVAPAIGLVLPRVRAVVAERAFTTSASCAKIVRGRLGSGAAALGAAWLARQGAVSPRRGRRSD